MERFYFLDHNICDFTYSHEAYLVMLTRTYGSVAGMEVLGFSAGQGNCPVWETPCTQAQMVLIT